MEIGWHETLNQNYPRTMKERKEARFVHCVSFEALCDHMEYVLCTSTSLSDIVYAIR